jgi:hypothetical protein
LTGVRQTSVEELMKPGEEKKEIEHCTPFLPRRTFSRSLVPVTGKYRLLLLWMSRVKRATLYSFLLHFFE